MRRRFGKRAPDDLGLWPRLALISCWTDGEAARAVPAVRRRFPGLEIQPKGLPATEGVVSVPLTGAPAPVAAVASHFLEFLPAGGGAPLLVDELDAGATYEVVLTTAGGLLRYRLGDLVTVEGRLGATPLLRFAGRADGRSDLAGEKLDVRRVESALRAASRDCSVDVGFAMLAPVPGDRAYDLFVEVPPPDAERLATRVEELLREDHSYRLCRELGQLGAVRARPVVDALAGYERALLAQGRRGGTLKPVALAPTLDWESYLRPWSHRS
ncbi:MAG: GH3 auxin-responsive promoter family protein [Actinomycetota bacterium]|nr:GH3 auxin-responsive promoter family protein [Actinomycetota bacterium]